MRVLYWLLGGAAATLATAYLAKRRSQLSAIDRFLLALDAGQVEVQAHWSGIHEPGVRDDFFIGVAGGMRFRFQARTVRGGIQWLFILHHGAGVKETPEQDAPGVRPTVERWNLLKGDRERSLAAIYFALKRLAARPSGTAR